MYPVRLALFSSITLGLASELSGVLALHSSLDVDFSSRFLNEIVVDGEGDLLKVLSLGNSSSSDIRFLDAIAVFSCELCRPWWSRPADVSFPPCNTINIAAIATQSRRRTCLHLDVSFIAVAAVLDNKGCILALIRWA